ncbi:MAG: prolyl oligopeptidase family serine peptidase [Pseudomonadota bacterium]
MKKLVLALTCALGATEFAAAQGYMEPPQEITDIVLRAPSPRVSLSPDGATMLLQIRESLPPVAELAKPMERLAGLRIDAATNDRHGFRTVVGLTLKDLATGAERPVALPDNADISDVSWSANGQYVAFTMTSADSVGLWVLDTSSGQARPVIADGINGIFGAARWLPDGRIMAFTIPEGRGEMPTRSLTPRGPAIQDASKGGQRAQTRTFQDLLKDPHDEAMFEWLATSQPVIVNVLGEDKVEVGAPGIYRYANASPDGQYLLMEQIKAPFSYQVPWYRFPLTSEVWDMEGNLVTTIADQPLADALPVQGVVTGRRSIDWHPTEASLLMWAEALDGGDPKAEATERDKLMALAAPFDGEPIEIARFEDRYNGYQGIEGTDDVMAVDYDRDSREVRTQLVDVTGENEPRLIDLRNWQDAYADPGDPITTRTEAGKSVARVSDGKVFLSGRGASPEGLRPFLRSFDLTSFETKEIWRNSGESYEQVVDLVAEDGSSFLTYYEDPKTPGNFRLHKSGDVRMVTDFADPHPELTGIKKELVKYEREDGVPLSATLYLPADYEEGDKLPVVVWAYPLEYNDAATAGQVRTSPYRFTRIGGYSHLFFLTQGYAIMDGATMPVVGPDPTTVNETFVEQIVMSAQAAIDETVERGFGDGERVGVGGHSYGAFMTAHVLAGSDIFRAGIARSGAYNRTLTPFGFQSERRTFWEAPESYFRLSPFMHAHKINEPMLMTHGAADNNSGTFPQQSERMFAAIKGNGGTTRLVMLPHESHGYRGRESVLHVLAEMIAWFDTYVKPESTDEAVETAALE